MYLSHFESFPYKGARFSSNPILWNATAIVCRCQRILCYNIKPYFYCLYIAAVCLNFLRCYGVWISTIEQFFPLTPYKHTHCGTHSFTLNIECACAQHKTRCKITSNFNKNASWCVAGVSTCRVIRYVSLFCQQPLAWRKKIFEIICR